MCKRLDRGHPYARQQLSEARVSREVGAQSKRVAEESQQRGDLRVLAARHRATEHDVVHTRIAVHEPLERSQQHREQRRLLATGQGPQRGRLLCLDYELARAAAVALPAWAGPVGGQIKARGCTGHAPCPVLEQLAQIRLIQPLALPAGIVRVLDWELWQRRLVAVAQRRIQLIELSEQQPA